MKLEDKNFHKINRRKNYGFSFLGFVFFVFGFMLIILKGFSNEYVDTQGVLHEKFFLLPIGFLFMFLGVCFLVIVLVKNLTKNFYKQKLGGD